MVKLVEAGSHPDMRRLERLVNEKTGNLARNISVDQVRGLGELFDLSPAMSDWRVVVIDTVDELEASGANALAEDARGAAAQQPVLPRQQRSGPAPADHPLALQKAGFSGA